MEGLYYLVMLLGITWLCVWSILPEQYRDRLWWPFDMVDADGGPDGSRAGGRAGDPPRPPGPGAGMADPAADLQHPLPKPRPAQSWRVRREQAQAPGRRR